MPLPTAVKVQINSTLMGWVDENGVVLHTWRRTKRGTRGGGQQRRRAEGDMSAGSTPTPSTTTPHAMSAAPSLMADEDPVTPGGQVATSANLAGSGSGGAGGASGAGFGAGAASTPPAKRASLKDDEAGEAQVVPPRLPALSPRFEGESNGNGAAAPAQRGAELRAQLGDSTDAAGHGTPPSNESIRIAVEASAAATLEARSDDQDGLNISTAPSPQAGSGLVTPRLHMPHPSHETPRPRRSSGSTSARGAASPRERRSSARDLPPVDGARAGAARAQTGTPEMSLREASAGSPEQPKVRVPQRDWHHLRSQQERVQEVRLTCSIATTLSKFCLLCTINATQNFSMTPVCVYATETTLRVLSSSLLLLGNALRAIPAIQLS